jgi:acetoin utilization deacetylase AcuC-like enzyme
MKIVSSPLQMGHRPEQIMVLGRMITPVESPARLEKLVGSLMGAGHESVQPGPHDLAPVREVHSLDYLDFLRDAYQEWRALPGAGPEVLPNTHHYRGVSSPRQPPGRAPKASISGRAGWFVSDLNCAIGPDTWEAVATSARCAIHGAQLVLEGEDAAFAGCRPPGHHAYADQAAGFCFINNAAVAAHMLRARFDRVAVIDFDTHHGDGTQSIFYERDDVFVGSVHTDPAGYYPYYVGYADERGSGAGEGANFNVPLSPGSGDSEFVDACSALAEAAVAHGCTALVVSAGWDAHRDDPLSKLAVSSDAFARVGERLGRLRLPTLIVQEGGYSLDVITDAPLRFVEGFSMVR